MDLNEIQSHHWIYKYDSRWPPQLEFGVCTADPVTCETRGSDLKRDEVLVLCPPGCAQLRLSVFGTGVYAAISSICGAAVHK
uniref:LCCL domain-containing protein n=1 Tax=Kryptolebias marmoratus TaxID=37003 RepID=A0A3Q3A734_KRYMA